MLKKIVRAKVLVSIVVFLLIATGVYFATGQHSEVKEKELLVVAGFVPESLDPVYLDTHNPLRMYGVIQYLFYISPQGKVVPELAKSYRNIDPKTWEVKLRPNVTFWSGKKVDAKAVKASLERSRKLAPQTAAILSGVHIEEVDSLTLRFVTEQPKPFLFYNIATSQFLAIHNAESFGNKVRPYDLEALDTTGFFRLVKFKSTEMGVVERFDGYWGDKPHLDRVTFRRNADPQSMVIEALSGKADIVVGIPTEGASLLEKSKDMDLKKVKGSVYSLYLNTRSPQLKDARVRQALGWGINRQEVVDLGYNGLGFPTPSWYSSHPAYPEAKQMGFTKYDPERAGQLLDEAGWKLGEDGFRVKNGQVLKIKFVAYGIHKAGAEVIQNQLKKIGIKVDLQYSKDWGFVVALRQEGSQWDVTLEAWSNFGYDRLWRHFAPKGDLNYSHFNDKVMSQLIDTLMTTFDKKKQHKLVLEINKRSVETTTIIPVIAGQYLIAVNKRVRGFIPPSFKPWESVVSPSLNIKE